jgi:hypothetical protein
MITLLDNGNILAFDNGLNRKWSRVVEMNPLIGEIVWQYRAEQPKSFYTVARGASQRLPNGNTLVTDPAHLFEVTQDGDGVWEFWNANRDDDGRTVVVVRARHVIDADLKARRFEWTD